MAAGGAHRSLPFPDHETGQRQAIQDVWSAHVNRRLPDGFESVALQHAKDVEWLGSRQMASISGWMALV